MTFNDKWTFDKILRLIDGGQKEEAYDLLKDLLIQNPEDMDAWETMLGLASNEKDRDFAKQRIQQLSKRKPNQVLRLSDSQLEDLSALPKTPLGWEGREIQQALELVSAGKSETARKIVDEVLQKSPNFPPALYADGILSESIMEYRNALAKLADLSKQDAEAKTYYQKLASWKSREGRREIRIPGLVIISGVVIALIFIGYALVAPVTEFFNEIIGGNGGSGSGDEVLSDVTDVDEQTCEELIANALDVSDKGCREIRSNQVCYGNHLLITEIDGPADAFRVKGDVLGVESLHTLKASPLDLINEEWGVAVFRLKANMEGTIPGQNVTFLVFGNTDIENQSGDMTAFYFSTGIGGITCRGVSFDGLQIEMDDGAGFEFIANGVEISLYGDAVLVARPGGELDITLANGRAEVTSDGVTQEMSAETSVSIPIDENLEATGPPTEVEEVSGEQASLLCQLFEIGCPPGEVSIILGKVSPTSEATELTALPPTTILPSNGTDNTPVPLDDPDPTNTPVDTPVAVCSQISARFTAYGKFQISNNSDNPVVLTSMRLIWPTINGQWTRIYLEKNIGSPNEDTPPATYSFNGHMTRRTFYPGNSKALSVDFEDGVKGGHYDAVFYFDNGCARLARN